MVELLTGVNTGGSNSIDDVLHSRCLPWEDGGLTSTVDYGVALVLNQSSRDSICVRCVANNDGDFGENRLREEAFELAFRSNEHYHLMFMDE